MGEQSKVEALASVAAHDNAYISFDVLHFQNRAWPQNSSAAAIHFAGVRAYAIADGFNPKPTDVGGVTVLSRFATKGCVDVATNASRVRFGGRRRIMHQAKEGALRPVLDQCEQ